MAPRRFHPPLRKRRILSYEDYHICSVNALAVRSSGRGNEEFDNFAIHEDFPHLIPKDEIWIAEKVVQSEGMFFLVNALTQLKEQARGQAEETAYAAALRLERLLRQKWNHLHYRGSNGRRVPREVYLRRYLRLKDEKFPIIAWIVDGALVRTLYKTDYTEGGHGYVYPWVPKDEIWIERVVDRRELPLILTHEYLELRLMRDRKIDYDKAHGIASRLEYDLRERRGLEPLVAPGGRELRKRDLVRLTAPQTFAFVLKRYVQS